MEPEENEQVIEKFLSKHPDFSVSDAKQYLPEASHQFIDKKGFFSTSPLDGLDGFFGARLQKNKD
jgi:16S rRNA (cytosine967-C5)-methyltransferase